MKTTHKALLLLLALFPLCSLAAETGWIEKEVGFEDKATGAKLKSIETAAETGEQLITIAIPKKTITSKEGIEEIVIIGHRPKETEFKIPFSYEWAKDFEGDYYGLVLKIGKDTQYPIRIFFRDEDSNKVIP